VVKQVGYKPKDDEFRDASREYFKTNRRAQAYFSLVQLYHNVCESISLPESSSKEGGNENNSYKVKIENARKLPEILSLILSEQEAIFRKDEDAEADFTSGKQKGVGNKSLLDQTVGDL
jgi:hypothetical protein